MTLSKNILVFTDLDGTLLDEKYSWDAAAGALERLKSLKVPVIMCSSKTRPEIESYRSRMEINDPFISENGGAVFIPKGYFSIDFQHSKESDGYRIIEFAEPYPRVRQKLDELRPLGQLTGFGDMTVEEISQHTGLPPGEAALAKKREYVEPFRFSGDFLMLQKDAERDGYDLTRGTLFWHLSKGCDKGTAVEALMAIYRKAMPGLKTVGLGNAPNDLPMLKKVDVPVWVGGQLPDNLEDLSLTGLKKSASSGPVGWNEEISALLKNVPEEQS